MKKIMVMFFSIVLFSMLAINVFAAGPPIDSPTSGTISTKYTTMLVNETATIVVYAKDADGIYSIGVCAWAFKDRGFIRGLIQQERRLPSGVTSTKEKFYFKLDKPGKCILMGYIYGITPGGVLYCVPNSVVIDVLTLKQWWEQLMLDIMAGMKTH